MFNDKTIIFEIDDYILHHNLNTLAVEHATTVDCLINISIRRLLDDIEFARELRKGNFDSNARQDRR